MPLWILGSSTYGAALAAALGLPFAFASHFAPDRPLAALELYRERSGLPSSSRRRTPWRAQRVCRRHRRGGTAPVHAPQQAWANRFRGEGGPFPEPIDDIETYWTDAEKAQASSMLTYSVVGSADTVRAGIAQFVELTASTR